MPAPHLLCPRSLSLLRRSKRLPSAADAACRSRRAFVFAALLLVVALAGGAQAADGRLELNQTCAVQTGCVPGDAPGFPVTIRAGVGTSFVLTSDLVLPDETTTGIQVEAIGVSVDLNRFSIVRDDCLVPGALCPRVVGGGEGIRVSNPNVAGLRVSNGSIYGVGGIGIDAGTDAEIEGVFVRQPGGICVRADRHSRVRGSRVSFCGGDGILAGDGSIVEGNTAYQVGFERSGSGIECGVGCRISGNTASANRTHGILAGDGSSVTDNVAFENRARGLQLNGAAASFDGNTLHANTTAPVAGGLDVGGNACDGSTTCP